MRFARLRSAVTIAVLLAAGSIVRYPGGTPRDHATAGYSYSRNFLSDLGMTVAYDGGNRLGALLFTLSLLILVASFGASPVGFVQLYSTAERARRLARAAAAAGFASGRRRVVAAWAALTVALAAYVVGVLEWAPSETDRARRQARSRGA